MSFFKILTFLWPFVKELMLGDKTLTEAFKTNKKKVFMAALVMLSFTINIYIIPKIVTISNSHVILQREHEEMKARYEQSKKTSPIQGGKAEAVVEHPPRQPAKEVEPQRTVSQPKAPQKSKSIPIDDRVAKLKESLDAIKRQEERDQ